MGETEFSTNIYICQSLGDWINLLTYMGVWVIILCVVFFKNTKIDSKARALSVKLYSQVQTYLFTNTKFLTKLKAALKFFSVKTIALGSNRIPYFVKTFNNKLKSWWHGK